jgi:hypothetical protein
MRPLGFRLSSQVGPSRRRAPPLWDITRARSHDRTHGCRRAGHDDQRFSVRGATERRRGVCDGRGDLGCRRTLGGMASGAPRGNGRSADFNQEALIHGAQPSRAESPGPRQSAHCTRARLSRRGRCRPVPRAIGWTPPLLSSSRMNGSIEFSDSAGPMGGTGLVTDLMVFLRRDR